MLENVKNLCSHDKGRTFKVIQESLEELNYKIFFGFLMENLMSHSIGSVL